MKFIRNIIAALLLAVITLSDLTASGKQSVEYLEDSIFEVNGSYIQLLGGSQWVLASPTVALITENIFIIFQANATAYVGGDQIRIEHVSGDYTTQTGFLTTVIESLGDGAVLKLADGSLISIPDYDQYDTGWWLPPYKALLTGDEMYLWNLEKGKRVWINP